MKRTKTQKGITLIALIITIVVLLILATVAITSIRNTGIIEYANNAANSYQIKQDEEKEILVRYEDVLNRYSGGAGIYLIGDKVKIGEEEFYVIEDSYATQDKVVLLAKQNIEDGVKFSSKNYWSKETKYPLDLNTYTIPDDVTSVITIAKNYAEQFEGATGRLLSKEEAEALEKTDFSTKLMETAFWLGDAGLTDGVYSFNGLVMIDGYDTEGLIGVRPVIEISKSNLS